jgi:hypothetical protein
VRVLPLPIPARRQFALAGDADPLRSPQVQAVLQVLRERRRGEKTRAYQAGVLRWS